MYLHAKEKYSKIGVNVDLALKTLAAIPISIHCWQGDDIGGFERENESVSGGIQVTGNYPGKARNPEELMADFEKAISLIPGKKRINLHASYAIFEDDNFVGRDQIEPKHFDKWIAFARKNDLGIDFNPTFFGHSKMKDGLTLSSPDNNTRTFWINHGKTCRDIAAYIAEKLDDHVVFNVWVPDGYKDVPADRLGPRMRLKDSLDQVFAKKYDRLVDCVESKVFGIGVESYTVGSSEFYIAYAGKNPKVFNLLDNGHYHPTEVVSDKIPSLLPFRDKIPLHITRAVRWDSDHVVLYDDETKEICKEIVRNGAIDKVLIGLDFFDATINRIAGWIVGTRSVQKALLFALLHPHKELKSLQDDANFTKLMVLSEEIKTYPFDIIWEHYCEKENVPAGKEWFDEVEIYENEVLNKR